MRPPFVLASVLLLMAALLAWSAYISSSLVAWSGPAVLIVAVTGLLLRQGWARWLVLVCAAVAWLAWFWAVGGVLLRGWPYTDPISSAFSLVPGVLWLLTWAGIAAALRKAPWVRS